MEKSNIFLISPEKTLTVVLIGSVYGLIETLTMSTHNICLF